MKTTLELMMEFYDALSLYGQGVIELQDLRNTLSRVEYEASGDDYSLLEKNAIADALNATKVLMDLHTARGKHLFDINKN